MEMVIVWEQRNNTVVINDSFIMYHTILKGIYEGHVSSSQEPHEHDSSLTSLAMVPHRILVWSDVLTINAKVPISAGKYVVEGSWWKRLPFQQDHRWNLAYTKNLSEL